MNALFRHVSPIASAERILAKQGSTEVDDRRRSQLRDLCVLGWLFVAAALLFIIIRSPVKATGDFVYFYSIGRLANEHPDDLYNSEAQQTVFDQFRPDVHGRFGPSPYPPFVALCFRPLASLSLFAAYRVWAIITLCLYVAGLWLLLRAFLPDARSYWPALFCGALLFWPFLARTLGSGQLSGVGFFAMSLALSEQQRRRYYMSGLALSLCLYKPTLLVWILPLLLIARAWRTLAGFSAAAGVLASITTAAFGSASIWRQYAEMTAHLGSFKSMLVQSDYLDVLAALHLASHGAVSTLSANLCLCIGAVVIFFAWRRALTCATEHRTVVAWGITLPLALLVNVYTPIYDSVLLIVSLIATGGLFQHITQKRLISGCLLLLGASFCSTWIAAAWRIQILSLLIAGISAIQLWLLKRTNAAGRDTSQEIADALSGGQ